MDVGTVVNLAGCFDCGQLTQSLSLRYEDDPMPYGIWILGDSNGSRIQVRLETSGELGELSMSLYRRQIADTEELIKAVRRCVDLMVEEVKFLSVS
jgi:hypothetical protein